MIKSNGGIIGPDNVTTGGAFGTASGVFKLGEVTDLIKESKWPTAGPQGFQVANSCRFNSGSSDALTKTLGSGGNRKTFTISLWTKPSSVSQQQMFLSADSNQFGFDNTGVIFFYENNGGTEKPYMSWEPNYRDTSAWYHICLAVDTTQSTNTNRIKLYVNGSQVTTFANTPTYPDQNQDLTWNTNVPHAIGRYSSSGGHYDGYMAEYVLIDGSALAPTSFGEFNSQTEIWVPKDVSGLTPGTNGFYLDFKDSANLGNDAFGGTDWTEVNLTSLDQSTDTCSTNFATLNSLENFYPAATISEGNLKAVTVTAKYTFLRSSIGVSSGKWYMETKCTAQSSSTNKWTFGITDHGSTSTTNYIGQNSYSYGWRGNANEIFYNGTSENYGSGAMATGNIIGMALDLDNNKIYWSINGTWKNSGNPAGNSNGFSITAPASTNTGYYHFAFGDIDGGSNFTYETNFGSPSFAISSGNTDGNGFGNFEYAVPTGYLSLNTKNLAAVLA